MERKNIFDEDYSGGYTPREYPKQLAAISREKHVCGFDGNFTLPPAIPANNRKPISFLESTALCSIRVTMANNTKGKTVVYANIPFSDIFGICAGIDRELLVSRIKPATASQGAAEDNSVAEPSGAASPAYTYKITFGKYSGITPAGAILSEETAENKYKVANDLCLCRDKMAENVDKYPQNQVGLDAINEAIKLYNAGSLDPAKLNQSDGSEGSYGKSSAYSYKLNFGKLKGRTPAAVLLAAKDDQEKSSAKADLLWCRDKMAENVDKYPKNQAGIDAITAAINLHEAGNLDPSKVETAAETNDSSDSDAIVVYQRDNKNIASKKDKDGNNLVYNICIAYRPAYTKSPWLIRVQNYYAPVEKLNEAGKQNVKTSQRVGDITTDTMAVTNDEMISVFFHLKGLYEAFLTTTFEKRYRMSYFDADYQYQQHMTSSAHDAPNAPATGAEYEDADVDELPF